MNLITRIFKQIVRFLVVWFVDTVSLLITTWIVSGISINPVEGFPVMAVATAASTAFPPSRRIRRPTSVAACSALATAPPEPRIDCGCAPRAGIDGPRIAVMATMPEMVRALTEPRIARVYTHRTGTRPLRCA